MSKRSRLYKLKVGKFGILNYCYIIVDKSSKEAVIIDPAWELKTINSMLKKLTVKLSKILLTHSHYDHVNMVKPLQKIYDSEVYISTREADYYNFKCQNLQLLQDVDIISLGNISIKSFLTPGHTAGSTCYLLDDALFTGDTIFIEGCGICNTNGGNPADMFKSIQYIKGYISPDVKIYPAHSYGKKPGYPLSYLLKNNIYFSFNNVEHFIIYRMRKNQRNLFAFK